MTRHLLRQIREQQETARRVAMRKHRAPLDGSQGSDPPVLVWMEFELQELHNEYMICKQWDGSVGFGDEIEVARDPELRKSAYHGRTITHDAPIGVLSYSYTGVKARTVTKGAATQDQIIIADYVEHVDAAGEDPAVAGTIISVAPAAVAVLNDAGDGSVWCQWKEFTQRSFANVE